MIKVENIKVYNVLPAIQGARNPLESWDRMDSKEENGKTILGPNDLGLMRRLFKAGKDHRKYTRQILVSMDITAPLYWFKEADTYKVGTTANSTSTMHKIMSKPFTADMFSFDDGVEYNSRLADTILEIANDLRDDWKEEQDPTRKEIIWRALIQFLPNAWLQKRHLTMNLEVLYNMYYARKSHKLKEWREFCEILVNEVDHFAEIAEIEK